jgi:hypothetical protein
MSVLAEERLNKENELNLVDETIQRILSDELAKFQTELENNNFSRLTGPIKNTVEQLIKDRRKLAIELKALANQVKTGGRKRKTHRRRRGTK